jgi:hypothetical protein
MSTITRFAVKHSPSGKYYARYKLFTDNIWEARLYIEKPAIVPDWQEIALVEVTYNALDYIVDE